MPDQFLVVTQKHGLTPFANRLGNDGHVAEIVVWKPRYERAWDGKFKSLVRDDGPPSAESLEIIQQALDKGDLVLVTDLPNCPLGAERQFTMGDQLATSPLRLGAWLRDSEALAPHLVVYDMGLWPGGLGLQKAAGATIIFLEGSAVELARDLLTQVTEKPQSGLVEVDIQLTPEGMFELGNSSWGWNWLQSHAFLASLQNFGELLLGEDPRHLAKFSTVIPVSVPPWPEYGRAAPEVDIAPLPPQIRRQVFWHDVSLDLETKQLRTAGLDGLVGVAHGSARQPSVARAIAVQVASSILVPEKQWRSDVGTQVEQVLEAFELHLGLVL